MALIEVNLMPKILFCSTSYFAIFAATISCHEPNRASDFRACAASWQAAAPYKSTLRNGLTPSPIEWAGRMWRVNAGSTIHHGMDHSLRMSPKGGRIRFELRDFPENNSATDSSKVRRAELSGSVYGDRTRLPNGEALWGAFSFVHHGWSDSPGMRELQGGVYGQIHIGSTFGGSPALAFRRRADGRFLITTRGEYDTEGTTRYEGDLSFDELHDVVYEVSLHPTRGSLRVWIDGQQIVDARGLSLGHSNAESYWNLGTYFSGGISGTVVAEYANHVYPAPLELRDRINTRPCWPAY